MQPPYAAPAEQECEARTYQQPQRSPYQGGAAFRRARGRCAHKLELGPSVDTDRDAAALGQFADLIALLEVQHAVGRSPGAAGPQYLDAAEHPDVILLHGLHQIPAVAHVDIFRGIADFRQGRDKVCARIREHGHIHLRAYVVVRYGEFVHPRLERVRTIAVYHHVAGNLPYVEPLAGIRRERPVHILFEHVQPAVKYPGHGRRRPLDIVRTVRLPYGQKEHHCAGKDEKRRHQIVFAAG